MLRQAIFFSLLSEIASLYLVRFPNCIVYKVEVGDPDYSLPDGAAPPWPRIEPRSKRALESFGELRKVREHGVHPPGGGKMSIAALEGEKFQ